MHEHQSRTSMALKTAIRQVRQSTRDLEANSLSLSIKENIAAMRRFKSESDSRQNKLKTSMAGLPRDKRRLNHTMDFDSHMKLAQRRSAAAGAAVAALHAKKPFKSKGEIRAAYRIELRKIELTEKQTMRGTASRRVN